MIPSSTASPKSFQFKITVQPSGTGAELSATVGPLGSGRAELLAIAVPSGIVQAAADRRHNNTNDQGQESCEGVSALC